MADTFPTVSIGENVRFNVLAALPSSLAGLFSRRRRVVERLVARNTDRRVVELLSRMRRKYGSGAVWVRVLGKKSLLLFGIEEIRGVLDDSPTVYADPTPKRLGMSHFQPNALTLSRGEEWRERRRFNEQVLASAERVHPLASTFLAVVDEEAARMLSTLTGELTWGRFEDLFEEITLRVVFGDRARNDNVIVDRLDSMMSEANRIFGLKQSRQFDPFYEQIRAYVRAAEPGSLVSRFAAAAPDEETRAENQLPHWMFATKDTLAANAYRTLAAIVSLPKVEQQVRNELESAALDTPAGIDSLRYLEGCIQEAMRLWPTTPLLGRETVQDAVLSGVPVPAGTQVFIVNTFNHRDRWSLPDADAFSPERWLTPQPDYRFNHFSNGPQVCPGIAVALFIGKAALAGLLSGHRIRLEGAALRDEPLPHMVDHFALTFGILPN